MHIFLYILSYKPYSVKNWQLKPAEKKNARNGPPKVHYQSLGFLIIPINTAYKNHFHKIQLDFSVIIPIQQFQKSIVDKNKINFLYIRNQLDQSHKKERGEIQKNCNKFEIMKRQKRTEDIQSNYIRLLTKK